MGGKGGGLVHKTGGRLKTRTAQERGWYAEMKGRSCDGFREKKQTGDVNSRTSRKRGRPVI